MNLPEAFVGYLESLGIGTYGQDIFIGQAPSSNNVQDNIWWLVASGGTPAIRLMSGETVKDYQVDVFYRNRDYKAVYDAMESLETSINCDGCTQLTGYETFDMQATTFPIDQDLDSEDRSIGLIQASLKVYQSC